MDQERGGGEREKGRYRDVESTNHVSNLRLVDEANLVPGCFRLCDDLRRHTTLIQISTAWCLPFDGRARDRGESTLYLTPDAVDCHSSAVAAPSALTGVGGAARARPGRRAAPAKIRRQNRQKGHPSPCSGPTDGCGAGMEKIMRRRWPPALLLDVVAAQGMIR